MTADDGRPKAFALLPRGAALAGHANIDAAFLYRWPDGAGEAADFSPHPSVSSFFLLAEQAGLGGLFLGALCREPANPCEFGFDAAIAYRTAEGAVLIEWNETGGGDGPAQPQDAPARASGAAATGAPAWRLALAQWRRRIDISLAQRRRPLVAVTHDAARGGAQILLLRLLQAVRTRAAEIDPFVVLLAGGPLQPDFAALGATILVPAGGDGATAQIVAGLAGAARPPRQLESV